MQLRDYKIDNDKPFESFLFILALNYCSFFRDFLLIVKKTTMDKFEMAKKINAKLDENGDIKL